MCRKKYLTFKLLNKILETTQLTMGASDQNRELSTFIRETKQWIYIVTHRRNCKFRRLSSRVASREQFLVIDKVFRLQNMEGIEMTLWAAR